MSTSSRGLHPSLYEGRPHRPKTSGKKSPQTNVIDKPGKNVKEDEATDGYVDEAIEDLQRDIRSSKQAQNEGA